MACAATSWLPQLHTGSCSNIFAPTDTFWLLLPHLGTFSHILAPTATSWRLLPHIGAYIFKSSYFLDPKSEFAVLKSGSEIASRLLALLALLATFLEPGGEQLSTTLTARTDTRNSYSQLSTPTFLSFLIDSQLKGPTLIRSDLATLGARSDQNVQRSLTLISSHSHMHSLPYSHPHSPHIPHNSHNILIDLLTLTLSLTHS